MSLSPPRRLGLVPSIYLGFALVVMLDAVFLVVRFGIPKAGVAVRLIELFYIAGHGTALALLSAIVASVWLRRGARVRIAIPLLFLLGAGSAALLTREELAHLALPWRLAVIALFGLGWAHLPLMTMLGRRWPRLRGVIALVGLAALGVNQFALESDYAGLHALLTLSASGLFTASLSGVRLRERASEPRRRGEHVARDIALGLAALSAGYSLAVWPSGAVLVELFKQRSPTYVHFLAPLHRRLARTDLTIVPAQQLRWYENRAGEAPIPPSTPPLGVDKPIVLLVTMDAFRADVFADPSRGAALPNLRRLAKEGTQFTSARSASSSTTATMAAIFSSKYYSQRYWTHVKFGSRTRPFLPEDTAMGFPTLLREHGVATGTFTSTHGLLQSFGVVRGFEHEVGSTSTKYGPALLNAVQPWLAETCVARSCFAFLHFIDAHDPYDRAGTNGTTFERYVRETELVDKYIGQLWRFLTKLGVQSRVVLIVTADHGEAFGEHATQYHSHTIYEELVRVPFFVRLPRSTAKVSETPVTSVDIAPTILDLFGLPIPADFMGESLLPLVRGEARELTRPILIDSARRMQAMVFPDGFKVIRNLTSWSYELYDLRADPGELENLIDQDPSAERRLSLLDSFFDIHELRRPGYRIPARF